MRRKTEDKRPDPKPRLHPHTWQAYLIWDELVKMRQRHELRKTSIEAGKSNLDAELERLFIEDMALDNHIKLMKKSMVAYGETEFGAAWRFLTAVKGLGEGGLAAQLLAQIDDIGKFDTVSKLWRFAGYAVIDGKREYNTDGDKSHYNRRLKSIVYLIVEQFIRQQTPLYADIYYTEKARLRRLHPEAIKDNGHTQYNDGHLHAMAMRKTGKIFLQHLWVQWRTAEGLPVSEPYVQAILGHTNIITAQELTQ